MHKGTIAAGAAIALALPTALTVSAQAAAPTAAATQAAVPAAAAQTVQLAATTRKGKLKKKERKDKVKIAVPTGQLAANLSVTGKCKAVVFKVKQANNKAGRKGSGQLSLTMDTNSGDAKVLIKKKGRAKCKAKWELRTESTRTAPASPVADPTTPEPPTVPAEPVPTPTDAVTPLDHGAVGDGVADDTAALKQAISSLSPGDSLELPAGKVFTHSKVLKISTPNVSLVGSGTLHATSESESAVHLAADGIEVNGPTFTVATTKRWVAYEQMKLRLGKHSNLEVRNVTVDGAGAAGIYVGGSDNFTIADVTVKNTRADAIHMTEAAHDGTVVRPLVLSPGDDGVAAVSYLSHSQRVRNIDVVSPTVKNQVWGRGVSVVGGQNIHFTNVTTDKTASAAIYIAAETEYNTHGVSNVTVTGANLKRSNQQADKDAQDRPSPNKGRVVHGAVMIYNSQDEAKISDVTLSDINIADTHSQGYDHVKVLSYQGQTQERIHLHDVQITGGSSYAFTSVGLPDSAYSKTSWTQNGSALADHVGF